MTTVDSRTAWGGTSRRSDADAFAGDVRRAPAVESEAVDLLIDEPRWAAWKVTLAVVVFCGAFWAGLGYVAMRLLG